MLMLCDHSRGAAHPLSSGRKLALTKINQPLACGLFLLYPAPPWIVGPYGERYKFSCTTTVSYTLDTIPHLLIHLWIWIIRFGKGRRKYFIIRLIHWFIMWSFRLESSRHCLSQTVRARELKLWENVNPLPCVTCHMSHVICHTVC